MWIFFLCRVFFPVQTPWQRRVRRGPIDKILFWCKCCKFSWLCLADSPSPTDPHPSGTVAWCQADLPSPPCQPPEYLANLGPIYYEIISDQQWDGGRWGWHYIISLHQTIQLQLPGIFFRISLIAELYISTEIYFFTFHPLHLLERVSGKHPGLAGNLTPRTSDVNIHHSSSVSWYCLLPLHHHMFYTRQASRTLSYKMKIKHKKKLES